jgi:hypothetical protein
VTVVAVATERATTVVVTAVVAIIAVVVVWRCMQGTMYQKMYPMKKIMLIDTPT